MYTQVKLPYAYDALEPAIDALTVETHYTKHHATYTNKLNELAAQDGLQDMPIETLLASWKREYAAGPNGTALKNNAGGFYNHNLYFSQLSPRGGREPGGKLAEEINSAFGFFGEFKEKISGAAVAQFGSGYAWLSSDTAGKLSVSQSPNQDNPLTETEGKLYPLFCIDVWEHAYYLQYKNLRPDYVKAFFGIVNWEQVADNYAKAIGR